MVCSSYPSSFNTRYTVIVWDPWLLWFFVCALWYSLSSAPIMYSSGGTSDTSNQSLFPRSCLTPGTWWSILNYKSAISGASFRVAVHNNNHATQILYSAIHKFRDKNRIKWRTHQKNILNIFLFKIEFFTINTPFYSRFQSLHRCWIFLFCNCLQLISHSDLNLWIIVGLLNGLKDVTIIYSNLSSLELFLVSKTKIANKRPKIRYWLIVLHSILNKKC